MEGIFHSDRTRSTSDRFQVKTVLYWFSWAAGIGLVLSIVSHVAALLGKQGPLGAYAIWLHFGIFVVWLPTVLAGNRLTRNVRRKDAWKVMLRGCPDWMKYMTFGFFGYALINFLIFMAAANQAKQNGFTPLVTRGFSGHWMAFYSTAMAVLYSASRVWDEDNEPRCPENHVVDVLAKYCGQCGLPVSHSGNGSQLKR